MGNYPRTGEYQSNHGKTVTSTPYRKRLPQRQETGQIHSTAFSYGNLRKQNLPLRQSLHYPQTGNRMYHILDGTPGWEPPRRGTRGTVELTVYMRPRWCWKWLSKVAIISAQPVSRSYSTEHPSMPCYGKAMGEKIHILSALPTPHKLPKSIAHLDTR